MKRLAVVCNSSALIALEQIGQLDLLERLFSGVTVPPAVVLETSSIISPATSPGTNRDNALPFSLALFTMVPPGSRN